MIYHEADFVPVGTGEKGGDAAAIRVWDDNGVQLVFVVDGGTKDSGKALVSHIQTHYGTSTVNGVILTHPDADHSSGLTEVLENLEVQYLFMHQPWDHADAIKHLFDNGALTTLGLQRKIREGLQFAHDLKKIAIRKNIPIIEPFAGTSYFNGLLQFLGPSLPHYQAMLPHFRTTPDSARPLVTPGFLSQVLTQAGNAAEWVAETLEIETLTDESDHFSAENSSSVIALFTLGTHKLLYTGDADINALSQVVAQATSQNISLLDLHLLDVPHHGSKQNLGPTVLNAIRARMAHISAPPTSSKHPAPKVINALIRRGMPVYSTKNGLPICYRSDNAQARAGWNPAETLTFSNSVEA
jgi:beta-lactamase superfamily II metal-dependent hydrolase